MSTQMLTQSPAERQTAALALARQLAAAQPQLATRAYRAAQLVDTAHVAVTPPPWNVYGDDRNVTGRVLSQTDNGTAYTIRIVPGSTHFVYEESAVETCECRDFGRTRRDGVPTCKHVLAVSFLRRLMSRENLLGGKHE